MFYAFRCMTMDIITAFSFGKTVDAIDAPDFKAPILLAMDASMPVFIRFKNSDLYKNMILKCPPKLSKILSPSTAGLVDLQQVCLWPQHLHEMRGSTLADFPRSCSSARSTTSPRTRQSSKTCPTT